MSGPVVGRRLVCARCWQTLAHTRAGAVVVRTPFATVEVTGGALVAWCRGCRHTGPLVDGGRYFERAPRGWDAPDPEPA